MWLQHQDFYSTNIAVEPSLVESPLDADSSWAYINWNRRTYQQVLGKEWNAS